MPEYKDITWKDLPGNKFSILLDAAMDSDAVYVRMQRVKGSDLEKSITCKVVYDREYMMEVVVRRFIAPLSYFGKDRVFEIMNLGWELFDNDLPCEAENFASKI